MAKKRKQPERVEEPTRAEFETFNSWILGSYTQSQWTKSEPSCFNGCVDVRKFRITTDAVVAQRIRKLWLESDNHHDWQPLMSAAAKVGLELDAKEFGKLREKRKHG